MKGIIEITFFIHFILQTRKTKHVFSNTIISLKIFDAIFRG